jgi:hypothetical protein
MTTGATGRYQALHELDPQQVTAVAALAGGATHQDAADAAGVHRVTVTRWANYHPEFIAELNRLRADNATKAVAQVAQITNLALDAIEGAVSGGDVDAAFRWVRLVHPTTVTAPPSGPIESSAVVEATRRAMPDKLLAMLGADTQATTREAEQFIADRLQAGVET